MLLCVTLFPRLLVAGVYCHRRGDFISDDSRRPELPVKTSSNDECEPLLVREIVVVIIFMLYKHLYDKK